ncbi:DMSO reductase anchor subunit [Lysobacter niabensis]|uniref:DMSO reductase anchor subunit n=1 Tax=Agrilutibacter niabensis TaxID=380628 RepID=A0ABU1VRP2_9GAMM|nr:DmsC/YnfH family molybdoenzyme membrane anchor subunit [Lysobacter niabensis]MDR7099893.1 DMSO reductase anchor subunit [Lysobacter niabensis]HKN79018.1 DmsC/YnfH family molybdoenzyme membrane anchor subunit [Lysobacter sp.]
MHPALSVIFFTSLSGAGYGLLFWSALAALFNWMRPIPLLAAVVLGLLLVTIGLLSSVGHLGKPQRAWRAFSQWRTSWLSREGVMAVATYVPAMALLLVVLGNLSAHGAVHVGVPGVIACSLLLVLTPLTVYCTAMIYASLKPIPAWCHSFVVPVYLLFALLTGGLLCATVAGLQGAVGNIVAMGGMLVAIVLGVVKWRYWHDIDNTPLTQTRADAVGLPGRNVSVFERPHTESNYLTREMGFIVARKHARRLRRIAIVLFALVPVLLLLPVWLFVHLDAAPWLAAAALSALAGAFVERWLFFAEAKHLVTLYY